MQKSKFTYVKAGGYYFREDLIIGFNVAQNDKCYIYFKTKEDSIFVTESAKTILKRMNANVKEQTIKTNQTFI